MEFLREANGLIWIEWLLKKMLDAQFVGLPFSVVSGHQHKMIGRIDFFCHFFELCCVQPRKCMIQKNDAGPVWKIL